jgi:uncharacterized protein
MTKLRLTLLVFFVVGMAAGTVFLWLKGIDRQGRQIDNGVVAFKRGDYKTAVDILTPYASRGNKTAQLNVGLAYAMGLGVDRDREKAQVLLRSALGDRAASTYTWVAHSFEVGEGVAKNTDEAASWYRAAAAEGSADAKSWVADHPTQR